MPLYEHVFIARQDLSPAQAEGLIEEFTGVLSEGGGSVVEKEYWGLRSMAFKINRNRKGHYAYLRLDAPAGAISELERRERLHEDVMRYMTVRLDEHETGPSAVITAKNSRDDRRGGGRDRDRDRDRDRGRDRDREPREPREPRPERPAQADARPAEAKEPRPAEAKE